MKKLILFVFLSLLTNLEVSASSDSEKKWNEANEAYSQKNYIEAERLYSSLLIDEYISSDVYYNLGNCYFKMNKLALAILNYNRALLLDPSNEDIEYNLKIATTQTTNRIDELPQFFLKRWIINLQQFLSSDVWAIYGLITLAVLLINVLTFIFSRRSWIRKLTFSLSITSLILIIFMFTFSSNQKANVIDSGIAIVMINSVAVKSSPSESGTDLFILNEGASVTVLENLGEWCEIVIASGNTGWISRSDIEYIRP